MSANIHFDKYSLALGEIENLKLKVEFFEGAFIYEKNRADQLQKQIDDIDDFNIAVEEALSVDVRTKH